MAYGNEDYRDFHYKSWKNLSNEQQGFFGGDKDTYRQYKEDHGLDGFKSAKDKAQTYQYDKQWKDLDDEYKAMHTHEQHAAARDAWQAGKGMDWDSTSDAYKMMIDKNLHSSWYTPSSSPNNGGGDPWSDRGSNQGNGPTAPGTKPNPPANPITNQGPTNNGQGNGPTAPSSSSSDRWSWNDPSKFWDKHTGGQTWGQVEDKDKYGEQRRLAYMSDAMGWGNYNDLDKRLRDSWENRGGREAYQASRDYVTNYGKSNGGGGNTDPFQDDRGKDQGNGPLAPSGNGNDLFDTRVKELMESRGWSKQQAKQNQKDSIAAGMDLNGDGMVTDEEYTKFQNGSRANTKPIEDDRGKDQGNGPVAPSGGGGNSGNDPWSWTDPTKFWEKHTDGQNWGKLDDKDRYGEQRRLAYMTDAMGWGKYNDLDERLRNVWEGRGGREAYQASKDWVQNYGKDGSGGGTSGGGTSGGGSSGGGSDPTTIVIENGNSGGDQGLSFAEQKQLADEQRAWQEDQNELARKEAQADREEARKEARIQTIIAGMNAAKNGNSWANAGGGRGPIWGGSGYSRGTRQGFTPWR